MINKLLNLNKLIKSAELSSLIKLAFINNARILYKDGGETVHFSLIGDVKGKPHKFGSVHIQENSYQQFENIPEQPLYEIHAQGLYRDAYLNLGYGKDLYLAAIKYASESNALIYSVQKSPEAKAVYERLKTIPNISVRDILVVESLSDENNVTIYVLTEDELQSIKSFFPGINYEESKIIYFDENYLIDEEYERFKNQGYFDLINESVTPDDHRVEVYLGHLVSGTSFPISIPVKRIEDDEWYTDGSTYENKLRESKLRYDVNGEEIYNRKEFSDYRDEYIDRAHTVTKIREQK